MYDHTTYNSQEIFPVDERQLLASLVAKGFQQTQQIRDSFVHGMASCFNQAFHGLLTASIEDLLMSACEAGLLRSHVSHCRSRKQNRFPYVEFVTSSGICWHFKYSPEKEVLPTQSSYRAANASLYNGQLFLDFEKFRDDTKYYKPSSQDIFAILTLGHNKLDPTFLKILFPNYSYTHAEEEIDLTMYLMEAYSKQFAEEMLPLEKVSEDKRLTRPKLPILEKTGTN